MSQCPEDVEFDPCPDTTPGLRRSLRLRRKATTSISCVNNVQKKKAQKSTTVNGTVRTGVEAISNSSSSSAANARDIQEGCSQSTTNDEDSTRMPLGQTQKKEGIEKRRRKFIEEDGTKLGTALDEHVKFHTRRNHLKENFTEMAYNEKDFDYMKYFMEPGDTHPLQTGEELEKMKHTLDDAIPEDLVDASEMGRLDFLPFHHVQEFDPEKHDIWGNLLNTEEMGDTKKQDPTLPIDPLLFYDPNNRPEEYEPEEPGGLNETLADMLEGNGEIPPISFDQISTLDGLEQYYKITTHNKEISKYGWCGPNFLQSKPARPGKKALKNPKPEIGIQPFDFTNIDFTLKENKFCPVHASKTTIDDEEGNSSSQQPSQEDEHADGFGNQDVELPRDVVVDFCSQPPPGDGLEDSTSTHVPLMAVSEAI